jgi:hypothetical protein
MAVQRRRDPITHETPLPGQRESAGKLSRDRLPRRPVGLVDQRADVALDPLPRPRVDPHVQVQIGAAEIESSTLGPCAPAGAAATERERDEDKQRNAVHIPPDGSPAALIHDRDRDRVRREPR